MNNKILKHFSEIKKILRKPDLMISQIENISKFLKKKIKLKKKIFVVGNGGSFADASHFVGELTATYTSKKLLNSYIDEIENLLNGFVEL